MKTTLITGTSKGIGNSICKYLISKNHRVISIARSKIDFSHQHMKHLELDITDSMFKNNITKIIQNEQIDNCIINAGVFNNNVFHKISYDDWFNTINTNLISTYNILNPVLNNMINNKKNGNIILISSVLGKTGSFGGSNYACSKSGIYGLTKSLALENASKNILINSISPGYIEVGMGSLFKDEYKQKLIEKIPLKRFGKSEDIINIIEYLTEKNNYMTGSNIDINGGLR